MMRTGFGDSSGVTNSYIQSAMDIMVPVMERSIVLAGHYTKACGRNTILPGDLEYAMKYCAIHTVGLSLGSILSDEDSDEDEDEDSDSEEEEEPLFVRYTGDDPTFLQVNDAYDRWNDWVPQNPTEQLLKNAIDSNEHLR